MDVTTKEFTLFLPFAGKKGQKDDRNEERAGILFPPFLLSMPPSAKEHLSRDFYMHADR